MSSFRFKLKLTIGITVAIFIVGYSAFQARHLLEGPQISLTSPKNGSTLTSSLVDITGMAANVSFISLNDRPIFMDKSGQFTEKLLLSEGYNAIKVEAKDKFGRVTEKMLQLVYKQNS